MTTVLVIVPRDWFLKSLLKNNFQSFVIQLVFQLEMVKIVLISHFHKKSIIGLVPLRNSHDGVI